MNSKEKPCRECEMMKERREKLKERDGTHSLEQNVWCVFEGRRLRHGSRVGTADDPLISGF